MRRQGSRRDRCGIKALNAPNPDIDAVIIMTPIPLNAPATKAALEAGKTVFVEKPFCLTVEEGNELIELKHKVRKEIFILEQVAYLPATIRIKELIADNKLGTPISFDLKGHFRMTKSTDPDSFASTSWRQNPEFPLGTLTDGGVHDLAKLSTIFGPPKAVTATGRKFREDFGEFDHILLLLEYENGISGTFSHSSDD